MGASGRDEGASRPGAGLRRAWRVAYLVAFLAIVCSFGASWCVDKLGLPAREALGLDRNRSYLEGKTYAGFPELSPSSFADAEFQDGIEDYIADRFPLRDGVLLANAAWQRALIAGAASVAGYGVYPTFYGSDYVYDAGRDEVVQILDEASAAQERTYERAAGAYRSFAERHPELSCYFYEVDRMSSSTRNPTHELMGPTVDTEFLDEHFFDLLGERVTRIDGSYADTDALAAAFFRTDHHWNGPAAYDAYEKILSVMMPGAAPAEVSSLARWDDVAFYGSTARSGLCLTDEPDHIVDPLVDTTGYEVTAGGKKGGPGTLDHSAEYAAGEVGADLFTNRYAEYFHGDFGLLRVVNPRAQSARRLLIVGDSFDNCVDRYFAANYGTVYVYDPRHASLTVEELLARYEVDDVLFLMGSTVFPVEDNYAQLAE